MKAKLANWKSGGTFEGMSARSDYLDVLVNFVEQSKPLLDAEYLSSV
jgi:hypothetical protein